MAKVTTTHVIEIETGIGEPAFIPLSMGHELQPISVGKKGMWRIESPRVLEVHAFVYFDGNSLFLQSADESNAASVDGFRVGKAWTELHAPCKIEIGLARLRFRSLLAEDNQPTAPVAPPAAGPGSRPDASIPVAGAHPPPAAGPRMTTGQRPAMGSGHAPPASAPPMTFPKADRPFRPGELAPTGESGESTRVAPLEAGGAGRMGPASQPRPSQGAYAENAPYGATAQMGYPQHPGHDPNAPPPYDPHAPQGAGPHWQQGYAPNPPPYGQPPYPNAGGPHGAMGASVPPGYGSMTPQGVQQPPPPAPGAGMQALIEKLKQNSIPKMIAGLLFIIGGIIYLAEDNDPPAAPRKPVAALDDAGASTTGTTGSPSSALVAPPVMAPAQPVWPAGVPCPPPNWPAGTPLPCTPNAHTDPPPRDPREPGPRLAAGTKTLERQAVDFVAAGEMSKAAAAYEELVRREPNNKVYAEAARILRGKLDAAPP